MLTNFVIIPILIAVFLYLFPLNKSARFLAVLVQMSLAGFSFWLFDQTKKGEIFTSIGDYYSVLGIYMRADLLSAMFVFLTALFFLVAIVYSFNENHSRLFWFLIFIWQGALIGIFLTADLFNVFVLTEVATVIVAVLIMYNRFKRSMYDGMIYLAVNVIAIQLYLFGLGYVYKLTGTLDMYLVAERLANYPEKHLMLPYAATMTFIALKCALIPLFGWLPKAHGSSAAPPAVSAILSGLHIKSSIYLFIRFQEVFETAASSQFFLVLGIATGIVGFVMAMAQTDIKLILAYHTVSQVGLIFTGLSISDKFAYDGSYAYSFLGGMYHMINHALFKGGLFLSAGVICKIYGTRDVYGIRGLLKQNPLVGWATLMSILGIIGAPFFNGSVSKYFMVSEADSFLNAILILMSLGTIVSFIKYSSMLFGKAVINEEAAKVSRLQELAIAVMGTLCFVTGVFGTETIEFLFNISVSVNTGGYIEKIFIFFLSLGAGFVIYSYYVRNSALLKRIKHFELGFRAMVFGIGLFFSAVLLFVGLL